MGFSVQQTVQRLGKVGAFLLYGIGYFLIIAVISITLSYWTGRILYRPQSFANLALLLIVPIFITVIIIAMWPSLSSDKHKRAQDVAFIIAGLIAVQNIFQENANNVISQDKIVQQELNDMVRALKSVIDTGSLCKNNTAENGAENRDKSESDPCRLIKDIAEWTELDIGIGVTANVEDEIKKELRINFDNENIETEKNNNKKILDKIEEPMWRTATARHHRSNRYIDQKSREEALETNAVYRNAFERDIALEAAATLYKVKQSDRAYAFWQTGGGLTTTIESVVGSNYKDRFLKYFAAFFSSIVFALVLGRAALTSFDDKVGDAKIHGSSKI